MIAADACERGAPRRSSHALLTAKRLPNTDGGRDDARADREVGGHEDQRARPAHDPALGFDKFADLNGIDAAIMIRSLLPKIKILLFSGQAATADLLEKARAKGYEFEILAKPVHPQDLLSRLQA